MFLYGVHLLFYAPLQSIYSGNRPVCMYEVLGYRSIVTPAPLSSPPPLPHLIIGITIATCVPLLTPGFPLYRVSAIDK